MWRRVQGVWQRLTGSLWFLPGVMVLAAVTLAIALVKFSGLVDEEMIERFPRIFGADAEASRSMLATIAGSIITVAGVSFSIVVVAVAQASTQYTPRILRNFLRDRPSQLALGVLMGTFVYCLVVIRTIRANGAIEFVPSVAVLFAFVLAIVSIGFLVYFIHHIAGQLEAGSILDRIGRETAHAVDTLFPDELGHAADDGPAAPPDDAPWRPITSRHTGYIQDVDTDGMMALARKLDVVIRMEHGVGEFVIDGLPIASVLGRARDDEHGPDINGLYTVAPFRTVFQDAEFGMRQIVDIALKALSTGMNDSTTAVSCVDRLAAVLVRLATRQVEDERRTDEEGRLRVLARGPTFESLLGVAFDEIRRNARDNVNVLSRMLTRLADIGRATPDPGRRALLEMHAAMILRAAEHHVELAEDRAPVQLAYERLIRDLRHTPPTERVAAQLAALR